VDDCYPGWAPDGKKIVFTEYPGDNGQVYVMQADGSNPTRVTNMPGGAGRASWTR
jgi:TolB protein